MTTDTEELRQTIRYTVAVEDVVALTEFHAIRSEAAKRKRHRVRVFLSVALALTCFALGYNMHLTSPMVIGVWFAPVFALMGGLAAFVMASPRFTIPRLLRYLVRRRYSKPDMTKSLGEHSLDVDDQGFTHRTRFSETRYAWGALERIETEPNHTYWYINSCQAIVIPHQKIIEGSFPAVLSATKQHYKPGQAMEQARKP